MEAPGADANLRLLPAPTVGEETAMAGVLRTLRRHTESKGSRRIRLKSARERLSTLASEHHVTTSRSGLLPVIRSWLRSMARIISCSSLMRAPGAALRGGMGRS